MAWEVNGEQLVTVARYLGAGLAMGAGAVGAAVGIGTAAAGAVESIAARPRLQGSAIRTMFIGQAIAESTAIYSMVVAFLLVFVVGGGSREGISGRDWVDAARFLAAGLCMGLGAIGAGVGSGPITQEAILGATRRPKLGDVLLRLMFLGQAIRESTAIYALVIAFLLVFVVESGSPSGFLGEDLIAAGRYLGAGLAMGLGAIGPAIGEGFAAGRALRAIVRQPAIRMATVRTMLVGMAVTESTGIYSLVVAFILLYVAGTTASGAWGQDLITSARLLGAGLAMGAGAIGPGVGEGVVAGGALSGMARNPAMEGTLVRTMFMGQAVTESTGIYSLVIAFILIFVVT